MCPENKTLPDCQPGNWAKEVRLPPWQIHNPAQCRQKPSNSVEPSKIYIFDHNYLGVSETLYLDSDIMIMYLQLLVQNCVQLFIFCLRGINR